MSNNLCQNGLGLVPKGIVGRLVSMCRELEGLLELPLEVQLQAHGNLVTCESDSSKSSVYKEIKNREGNGRTYPSSASQTDFRQACRDHAG